MTLGVGGVIQHRGRRGFFRFSDDVKYRAFDASDRGRMSWAMAATEEAKSMNGSWRMPGFGSRCYSSLDGCDRKENSVNGKTV